MRLVRAGGGRKATRAFRLNHRSRTGFVIPSVTFWSLAGRVAHTKRKRRGCKPRRASLQTPSRFGTSVEPGAYVRSQAPLGNALREALLPNQEARAVRAATLYCLGYLQPCVTSVNNKRCKVNPHGLRPEYLES